MAEPARVKQIVLWAVFVLLTSLVIYRLISTSGGPLAEMPDTPESAQAFVCRECGHLFYVTPRQRAKLMAQGGDVERAAATSARKIVLPCPACGQVAAGVAGTSPQCGRPYLRTGKGGTRHRLCPDCRAQQGPRGEAASGRRRR